MKFSTLFCGIAALASSVSAVLTTGAGGGVQTRFEIRQLQTQAPRQFTLFLLAMQQWYTTGTTSLQGYYQIAGIHGVPRISYDGVARCSTCTTQAVNGYCTHDSILFLAWHRTYLALVEQQLVSIAQNIASQYPSSTRAAYQAAASSLRLPYWDWAARPPNGGNNLPQALTAQTVSVNTPTGTKSIANPLYQYNFPSGTLSSMVFTPFTSWPNTLRYPTSNAASATSNEAKAIQAFNNIRASLQDRLYQIFSTCTTYAQVGLDSSTTDKCSNSLEGLHNVIHTTSGGPAQKSPAISGGHMTYLSNAAFDPIFWVHHANVDRLFAMWQAVYPNSYGATQNNVQVPTWTIPVGATVGVNSPLTPFRKTTSAFWTTAQVQNHKIFNYDYPEFVDSNGSQQAIQSYINKLYGPSATATAGSSKRTADPEPVAEPVPAKATPTVSTPLKAANGSLYQYVANIATSRYALNGSYNIFLFDGEPTTTNPADYIIDPNLIGPMGVLAMSNHGTDVTIYGSIPLTRTLGEAVTAGKLSDLSEDSVTPYLKNNIKYYVVGPTGAVVDPTGIPNFDVSIFASTATVPAANELPDWSEFIPLTDVSKTIENVVANVTSELPGVVSSVVNDVTGSLGGRRVAVRF